MATVAGLGCVTGLIAVAVGSPAALRGASAILAVAAGIGLLAVILVNLPSLPWMGRRGRTGVAREALMPRSSPGRHRQGKTRAGIMVAITGGGVPTVVHHVEAEPNPIGPGGSGGGGRLRLTVPVSLGKPRNLPANRKPNHASCCRSPSVARDGRTSWRRGRPATSWRSPSTGGSTNSGRGLRLGITSWLQFMAPLSPPPPECPGLG